MATSIRPAHLPGPDTTPTWSFYSAHVSERRTASNSPTSPTVQRQSTMERRSSLLGSLRSKFTRKPDTQPGAPERNTARPNAPATRRPGQELSSPLGGLVSLTVEADRPGMNAFTTPSNEPPPAYSAQPIATPDSHTSSLVPPPLTTTTAPNTDDAYSFLTTFDTIFLIDDSGSMAGRSWRECTSALEAITPICTQHDSDGIDLYFLNAPDSPHYRNVTEASTVHEIFSTVRPQGGTPTGQVLSRILRKYLRELEASPDDTKPINIIVITDGVPADDVETVLINTAQKLDRMDAEPWQIGVQFFQVGEEEGAREHLEGLDDELSRMGGGCRDIVDTVPFVPGARGRGMGLTADGILKVVLGAVNKRLDRRRNSSQLEVTT
ncbi:hypothetical protein FH972_025076 [Carpinus fangiana]|uniref:VWFA domain-containing protein n=1 Tax=Carpinus fangiana TaxID=176857 RepID=A0A5N6KZZ5_9ROSI|nr:hypothetical protein FH972_025076 [Carpinus fangiana]